MEQLAANTYFTDGDDDIIAQTKAPEKLKPPKIIPIINVVIVDKTVKVRDIEFNIETDEGEEIEYQLIEDDDDDDGKETQIFVHVEEDASFPGGEAELMRYLAKTKYPQMAIEGGIQGTVLITFVVEKSGIVSNVSLLRGIGSGCDKEAMKIVENMPKWNPGKQRELPVRVQIVVPIKFILSN